MHCLVSLIGKQASALQSPVTKDQEYVNGLRA